MANLDTRAKRASAIAFDLPWRIWPNPDGGFDQADRQQIAYKYVGILAGGAVVVLVNYHDLDSQIFVYLHDVVYAGTATNDNTTLLARRLSELTDADATARFKAIIVSSGGAN